MNNLLAKLIKKQTISEKDIEKELNNLCSTHFDHCMTTCPLFFYHILSNNNGFYESIYKKHNQDEWAKIYRCPYYCHGKKMFEALERYFEENEQ